MSVEIPKDPRSLNSTTDSKPTEATQPASAFLSAKDSLETFKKDEISTRLTPRESRAPELNEPQSRDNSIVGSFKIWSDAIRAFRNQLSASDSANMEARGKFSQLAVTQAEEISKLIAAKAEALAKLKEEIANKLGGLKDILDKMRELEKKQREGIDRINGGNEEEKRQYEELTRAYDEYLSKVKELEGIEIDKDGNFLIPDKPPETKEKYNELTRKYQNSVATFNDYWKKRSSEINKYNAATIEYNKAVAKYNQEINQFIDDNKLRKFLEDNGITLPQLKESSQRNLSGYLDHIPFPVPITSVPGTVPHYPLPDYVRKIAQAGPGALPKLVPSPNFDPQVLYTGLYNQLYESRIAPLDQEINRFTSYWSFVNRQILQKNKQESSTDGLLNSKPLAQRLLPAGLTLSRPSLSSSSLAMQTMGIDNPHVQVLMGQALLKQVIKSSHLKALEGLKGVERDKKIEQLTDQVLILSVGLLGNQSMQSLFPSLGILSDSLASLPKDSPAFAILFAVSLSNRIQEGIKQGTTAEALQTFLDKNPDFTALPTEEKAQLEAALNLGQLMVVGKLIEDSLGLPGLLNPLMPSLLPTLNLEDVIPQAEQEVEQGQLELQTQMKDHFIQQSYSEDQAQFLAQVGSDLTQQGLLTPAVTANISPKTLNQPLLVNSVKAELVLAHYSLDDAHAVAHEAVDLTLADAPYPTAKQFRAALESNLVDLQVKMSPNIAAAAVLIPLPEPSLPRVAVAPIRATTPSIAPASAPPAPQTPPIATPPQLSPIKVTAIVEKRILQLLVPQLGTQLAQQVSQEMAKTLFGTIHPDSSDIAQIKSPYALVNVVRNQLYHLNVEQNRIWTNAVVETFKESIKTMVSFYAFSLKIMDPAYLFVFASGIIYGDQGRNKPIAIPI